MKRRLFFLMLMFGWYNLAAQTVNTFQDDVYANVRPTSPIVPISEVHKPNASVVSNKSDVYCIVWQQGWDVKAKLINMTDNSTNEVTVHTYATETSFPPGKGHDELYALRSPFKVVMSQDRILIAVVAFDDVNWNYTCKLYTYNLSLQILNATTLANVPNFEEAPAYGTDINVALNDFNEALIVYKDGWNGGMLTVKKLTSAFQWTSDVNIYDGYSKDHAVECLDVNTTVIS